MRAQAGNSKVRRWASMAAGAGVGLAGWQLARRARRPRPLPQGPNHRVVVLGAGFGGIAFIEELHRRLGTQQRLDVLLVDRKNYNLFTPMLYQVATGLVEPDHITYPLRDRVQRAGANFQESIVQDIDLEGRRVITDDGPIGYDTLVVAVGSVTNFFGMQDMARDSLTLKTLGDAIAIRNRIVDLFERADVTPDPEQRRELLTFNVVGAGATGMELATAMDDLFRVVMLCDYPHIRRQDVRIRMVEAQDRAVPEMDAGVSRLAVRNLQARGIQLLLGVPVAGIEGRRLRLKDGSLLAPGSTFWTAGVRANALVNGLPADHGHSGRVKVDDFLQLPEHPEVFCIGDVAEIADPRTRRPVPPNAPAAIQMGQWTARNIEALLRGAEPEPFRYRFEGELLSLGRNRAIVHYHSLLFNGLPAWVLWRAFYMSQLMGWENRAGVFTDWIFTYFTRRRETARLTFELSPVEEGIIRGGPQMGETAR